MLQQTLVTEAAKININLPSPPFNKMQLLKVSEKNVYITS